MLGAGVVAMAVMCLVNHFWKISAHCCGMGALTGFLFVQQLSYAADYSLPICIIILLSGAVASARVYLKAHTLMQTLAGYLTGFSFIFIAGIIGFLIFLNL
jgi:membrane-associated phospholipid phosphatase